MIPLEMTSQGRRKFFGMFALGAAAVAAAVRNPLSLLRRKERPGDTAGAPSAGIAFTPNPLAVHRTQKGAAHHG